MFTSYQANGQYLGKDGNFVLKVCPSIFPMMPSQHVNWNVGLR